MNWVSSTLQLAEDLLESVDQQAAITLLKDAEADKVDANAQQLTVVESDIARSRIERASGGTEDDEWREFDKDEASVLMEETNDKKTASESLSRKNTTDLTADKRRLLGDSQCDFEQTRLRKDVSNLKQECSRKDKLLRSTQQNAKSLEKELEELEKECAKKLKQLQLELSKTRTKHKSEKEQLKELLATKDAVARSLRAELDQALCTVDKHHSELLQLRQQLQEAHKANESVTTKALSTSDESEQLIASLKNEVQETLSSMNTLKREFAESKVAMYASQLQLENTNEELAAEVARLQRERLGDKICLTKSQSFSIGHSDGNDIGTENFGDVVAIKKALHDELRRNEMHQQEIASLNTMIAKCKSETEKMKANASHQQDVFQQEIRQLQDKIRHLVNSQQEKNQLVNHTIDPASDSRIQTLTNRILDKQETIDSLRSKLITLQARLTDAQYREQLAEEKLDRNKQNESAEDIETGGHRQSRFAPKRSSWYVDKYAPGQNHLAQALLISSPAMRRYKPLVSVLNAMDQCFLFFGRRFLRHPFTRIGMMAYFILLHVWVFVILSFHTNHLNEELQAESRLKAVAGTDAT